MLMVVYMSKVIRYSTNDSLFSPIPERLIANSHRYIFRGFGQVEGVKNFV